MYCNKANANQLTALLIAHGIRDIVVCPGSRNGVLAHNFHAAPLLNAHPVTDERSAGFVTLGLALATGRPAAVCVTSGSALLATLPAVSEAYYRHIPLIVISADRPPQWIGQMDGQTLPQQHALQPYADTYNIIEPQNETERWGNNRLINEALCRCREPEGRPVHFNLPISEPLFAFTTPALPCERMVKACAASAPAPLPDEIVSLIAEASNPLLVVGQCEQREAEIIDRLDGAGRMLVLPELTTPSALCRRTALLEADDHLLYLYSPDVVVHIGGNFIGKAVKRLLREYLPFYLIRIDLSDTLCDTFCHLTHHVQADPIDAAAQLLYALPENQNVKNASAAFDRHTAQADAANLDALPFSDLTAMRLLAKRLERQDGTVLHLGNSSVVRNAVLFFDSHRLRVHCNRGVNGIEGSLSTAVGHALGTTWQVWAVLGDLSALYDANALWNTQLPANLRIVVFNNGGGQIFSRLPGLYCSEAAPGLIAAAHGYSLEHIAAAFGLEYHAAHSLAEADSAFTEMLATSGKAQLTEIFTRSADNEEARIKYQELINALVNE